MSRILAHETRWLEGAAGRDRGSGKRTSFEFQFEAGVVLLVEERVQRSAEKAESNMAVGAIFINMTSEALHLVESHKGEPRVREGEAWHVVLMEGALARKAEGGGEGG